MEFSKKLAVGILSFCGVIFIATYINFIFQGKDVQPLLDYIQPVMMTIIISYFGKSAAENVMKVVSNTNKNDNGLDG